MKTFIADLLGKDKVEQVEKVAEKNEQRIKGKITKVDSAGWGFISSKDIPFTRIFFHWQSLMQDTLKFPELKKGMRVEFVAREQEGRGFHAIKIRVLQ